MVQWTLLIPEETDKAVREFLESKNGDEAELSRFVAKIVNQFLFHELVRQVKERNAQYDQDEILRTIDKAVQEVRKNRVE